MRIFNVLIFLLLGLISTAQDCTLVDSRTILPETVESLHLENITKAKEGGLIAYNSYKVGENYSCEVERLDYDFNQIWTYEIQDSNQLELYHVVENVDNTLLLIVKSTESIFIQKLSAQGALISEVDISSFVNPGSYIRNIIKEGNHWTLLTTRYNDMIVKIDDQGQVIETKQLDPYFEKEFDPYDFFISDPVSNSSKILDYDNQHYLLVGSTDLTPNIFGGQNIQHVVKMNKATYTFEAINLLDKIYSDQYSDYGITDIAIHRDKSISLLRYARSITYDAGSNGSSYIKLDSNFNQQFSRSLYTPNTTNLYLDENEEVYIIRENAIYKVDEKGYLFWGSDYIGNTAFRKSNINLVKNGNTLYFNLPSFQDSTVYNRKVKVDRNNGCVNFMSGFYYYDEDEDCIHQSSDYGIQGMRLEDDFDYREDIHYFAGNPDRYFYTDENGYFQFPLVRDTGTFKCGAYNPLLQSLCLDSIFYDVRDSVNFHLSETNFPVWSDSLCSDISLSSAQVSQRICSSGKIKLFFRNDGLLNAFDQRIKIKTDGKLIIDATDTNIESIISGEYYLKPIVKDLYSGRSIQFTISDSVSCDAQLNDLACIYTEIELDRPCDTSNPIIYDTICVVLVNSYDPNDIVGLIDGKHSCYNPETTSKNIEYTVRFQNTGNDTAFNVTIIDTLGQQFDIETLAFLYESHSSTYEILQDSILKIDFHDINLLDTSWYLSPEMTEGFIQFNLDAKFDTDTQITNRVGIYFDTNDPIITNTSKLSMCDEDSDGFPVSEDCDDYNPLVNFNQVEEPYNGYDDDCDPTTLDDDLDQDGFILADDCDDTDSSINPNQTEIPYNGIDDDCNPGTADDDVDRDGFNLVEDCDDNNANINLGQIEIPYNGFDDDCNVATLDDDLDQDDYTLEVDCDDNNANINPVQNEIPYNGYDDDCNPITLDNDLDQDGYMLVDDCDDTNSSIYPNQTEIPYNGIDDDCNPESKDDDIDHDGYNLADDCNDNNATINPNQTEVPYNGLDDDCNASTLDDDLDQDGYILEVDCDDNNETINPSAVDIPGNGTDENCDGTDSISLTYEISEALVSIYPNPAVDIINITVYGNLNYIATLYNATGVSLQSTTNNLFDVSEIPNGLYFLEIKETDTNQKIVKRIFVGN